MNRLPLLLLVFVLMHTGIFAQEQNQITLAIGGEEEEGYDPTLGWGRYGAPLFQSTLLRRDEDLNIVNDLATSYSVSENGLVWTVTIREDAFFTDGELVTAEDVAYTFNTAAQSAGLTDLTVLDEAVVVDEFTVELRLSEAQSTFINRLVSLGIVPSHAHGEDYARNPIGSGPFKFVRWDEGQQLIVEANPDYYGGVPAIDRLVFLFLAEDAAFAAARAGQVDLVAVPQAFAIQSVPGMTLIPVQSVDNRGILFPFVPDTGETTAAGYPIGNNVTSDVAIRRAINYAIDRQALVDGLLEGYGSPAFGPVSGLPWEETSAIFNDSDLATAHSILADGGWVDSDNDGIVERDGLRAEFTLLYPATDSTRQSLALAAADMVREIGIQVNVDGRGWDDIEQMMHSNAVLFGWGSHDPTEVYNLYHSSYGGVSFFNTGFYANEQVDEYLDLAMGAPTQEEANVFWKAAQWDETTGFTTPGDAAWAWLVNLDHTYFVSDCLNIGNPQIEPHGHGWPITANIASWTSMCS